jgi:hypothetical protein
MTSHAKNYVKMCLALVLVNAAVFLMGSHTNIVGVNVLSPALFDNVSLTNASTTYYSTPDTSIGRSESQSVQYRCTHSVSSTTQDVAITVQTTLEDLTSTNANSVNWATPDSGATIIAHLNDNNWHSTVLSIPVCKAARFLATTQSVTNSTIKLYMGAQ